MYTKHDLYIHIYIEIYISLYQPKKKKTDGETFESSSKEKQNR